MKPYAAAAILSIVFAPAVRGDEADSPAPVPLFDFAEASAVLKASCSDCHGGGAAEGEFALEELSDEQSLRERFERWQKVRERIADRSMPPSDAQPMPDADRESIVAWVESASTAALCSEGPKAGPPLLRRLSRHEYSNTVRDLLDIHFDAGRDLPEDAAGGEGFSNAAETLTISPIHAEKYLQAAIDALAYAAKDTRGRERLLATRPGEELSEDEASRQNLRSLAERAFRRPVEDVELDPYVELFRTCRAEGMPFDDAVLYAMRGVLVSPNFLFIAESTPAQPGVPEPLNAHELATRLSYFLWASTPDDELREAADAGRLCDPEELERQTLRMIGEKGTHLQDSMLEFVGSWLGTADLGRSKQIDREKHPWVEEPLVADLREQPVYAMVSILQENDPITDLIDAPWTFLNSDTRRLYKIREKDLDRDLNQNLKRVKLPEEHRRRGGLLGMGGVMAVSSYPRRSSPVLRGIWVQEKFLGVELPPPPPDVPSLDGETEAEPATLRARLERHRADAACATCHDRIDPLGFALENFDELGRWRDADEGGPIDAAAAMPDGTSFEGIEGLKKYLLDRKDTFARVLTRKMLGYALGRGLQPSDLCAVESIAAELKEKEYRGQALILAVVRSEPFRMKMVPAASAEEDTLEALPEE